MENKYSKKFAHIFLGVGAAISAVACSIVLLVTYVIWSTMSSEVIAGWIFGVLTVFAGMHLLTMGDIYTKAILK